MKYSLGICIFPILLFSSISLHWSLRKAFLSLLAFLWNSAFRWIYLSFSPLPLASLLFSAICKAFSDNFALLHFFFLGVVLIIVSCAMLRTSVHSSSDTLSYLIPWNYYSIYLPTKKWMAYFLLIYRNLFYSNTFYQSELVLNTVSLQT